MPYEGQGEAERQVRQIEIPAVLALNRLKGRFSVPVQYADVPGKVKEIIPFPDTGRVRGDLGFLRTTLYFCDFLPIY
jgi:hypothetical protein